MNCRISIFLNVLVTFLPFPSSKTCLKKSINFNKAIMNSRYYIRDVRLLFYNIGTIGELFLNRTYKAEKSTLSMYDKIVCTE